MSGRARTSEMTLICLLVLLAATGCQMAPAADPTSRTEPTLSAISPETAWTRTESAPTQPTAEPLGSLTTTGVFAAVEDPSQEGVLETETKSPPEWRFTASLYGWLASKSGVIDTGSIGITLDDPYESSGIFVYLGLRQK